MIYDSKVLNAIAIEHGYVKNTYEKVLRLVHILRFINENSFVKEKLALKGGTALNLLYDDLPRLSVDIDLDYTNHMDKESMLEERETINKTLIDYFIAQGYLVNKSSKKTYSLDSHVISYTPSGGGSDNIKVEINYSMRGHLLPYQFPYILANAIDDKFHVYTVSKLEIYSGKINALLSRTQIRDLYDLHRIIKHQQIEKEDLELLKSLVIVYKLISNKDEKLEFDIHHIDLLTKGVYVRQLLPVLKKGDKFDMDLAKSAVKMFLKDLLDFNSNQKRFIDLANDGVFDFGLLFTDRSIIEKASNHPMILWKLDRNNSMKN